MKALVVKQFGALVLAAVDSPAREVPRHVPAAA